ncbi:MAG TPA: hypothetical protein VF846_05635 [Thermoanaerobaculia bacterium]|jgi:hypothetical protein
MARHAFAFAFALLIATAAEATWIPTISKTYVTVGEGSTTTVTARAAWSGVTDYGFTPWTFFSDNESVAVVSGRLDAAGKTVVVEIRGVGVGVANIKARYDSGEVAHWDIGSVAVLRENAPADVYVTISPSTIRVGQPFTLTAIHPEEDATYVWYWGELGDGRRPVGTGPELTMTPIYEAPHRFWLLAVTPRGTAMRPIVVEVPSTRESRRRSVRH